MYNLLKTGNTCINKSFEEDYIRRERSCSVSRSYYVGDIDKEAVKAKYENGVLTIDIPKEKPALHESHNIVID